MEGSESKFIQVKINNKKHLLPPASTFKELKLSILKEFGKLALEFTANEASLALSLNPKLFNNVEVTIDEHHNFESFGKKGNSFRCSNCRGNLSTQNFMCSHTSSCRKSLYKEKHSLLSETISSIEINQPDSDKSSFLWISKTESKSLYKNNVSCSFFTQDTTNAQEMTNLHDDQDMSKIPYTKQ